jgi:hypothetical protein
LSSGLRINRARDDAAGLSIANAFKNIGFSTATIGTALTQAMVDAVPANPISVKREFTLDSSTDPTGVTNGTKVFRLRDGSLDAIGTVGSNERRCSTSDA